MKKSIQYFFVLVLAITQIQVANAQKVFTNDQGVAIDGYDLVAYHTENAAVKGNVKHVVKKGDVTYHFSSAENKSTFEASPERYLPKYDGYCAFAIAAKSAKVPTDPKTFKLYNGELYLFFNDLYEGKQFNTIIPWNADEANLITKADAEWKKL